MPAGASSWPTFVSLDMGKGHKLVPLRKQSFVNNGGDAHVQQPAASDSSHVGKIIDFTGDSPKAKKKKKTTMVKGGIKPVMKRGRDDVDDDDDDDDDDDESSDGDIPLQGHTGKPDMEEYTFEFNDIKEAYTESICSLLRLSGYMPNSQHAYNLALEVVSESSVGTAVVCEGAEDVFAFGSATPLAAVSKNSLSPVNILLKELKNHLATINNKETTAFYSRLLDNSRSAETIVLLHRRFTNMPLQLLSTLHRNVVEDVLWAKKGGKAEFKAIDFVLTFCVVLDGGNGDCGSKKKKAEGGSSSGSGNKSSGVVTGNSSLMFESFEDEPYFQQSDHSVRFKSAAMPAHSIVVCAVPIAALDKCLVEIDKLCL